MPERTISLQLQLYSIGDPVQTIQCLRHCSLVLLTSSCRGGMRLSNLFLAFPQSPSCCLLHQTRALGTGTVTIKPKSLNKDGFLAPCICYTLCAVRKEPHVGYRAWLPIQTLGLAALKYKSYRLQVSHQAGRVSRSIFPQMTPTRSVTSTGPVESSKPRAQLLQEPQ